MPPTIYSHTSFAVTPSLSGTSSGFDSNHGDAIFALVSVWGTNTVVSVKDSAGDTFSQLVFTTEKMPSYSFALAIWAAYGVVGGSGVTLTVALAGSGTHCAAADVMDVTGVGSSPLGHLGTPTFSTMHGQVGQRADNEITANAGDLVIAAISSHNYARWSASGVDTLIDSQNALTTGVRMAAADLQYAAASDGGVWMNATANIAWSEWIEDSFTLRSGASVPEYAVTFTESGLVTGTSWSVDLAGTTYSSTSTAVTFTEPNGTYSFELGSVPGFTASPPSGSVKVSGAAVTTAITFTAIEVESYSVTFTESGLPTGTTWSVILNGETQSSSTVSIAFTEPNGTYSFAVSASGYDASSQPPSPLTVGGADVPVSVTFTASGPSSFPRLNTSHQAGYFYRGAVHGVENVSANWTIPSLACASGDDYVEIAAGIDGIDNGYREAVGTLERCHSAGTPPQLEAFWQFNGKGYEDYYTWQGSAANNTFVYVGDTVHAWVTCVPDGTTLEGCSAYLDDAHTGKLFVALWGHPASPVISLPTPASGGAVYVQKAYWGGPLINFGDQLFTNITLTLTGSSAATDFTALAATSVVDQVYMMASGAILAAPLSLTQSNGQNSFTIQWKAAS